MCSFPVDHWQDKRRWIGVIVIDGVGGLDPARSVFGFFFCVQISIEARKVAAGDLQTDAMSCEKDVAGRPSIDLEFIDVRPFHELSLLLGVTIAGTQNAVRQVLRITVGMNIN